ncbi:MAG: FtsX-like permease family protein [Desulfocapsaceae bacterium]|nr:FtsX-like permease family protein [Desulfocapsaceae bacterium]
MKLLKFLNLLRHISLKHVRLQKAQLIMAVSGICLGVAVMVSIDLVNRSVLRSFEDSINQITGRAVLQITGADSGFPEEMLDRVQGVAGVEYAVPVIETNANFSGGKERALMILGIDVLQDHKIRDYSITDESADIPDPLLFLAKRESILLTRTMAAQEGIKIDDEIKVQTVAGIKTFKVRGLLNPEGPARVAGGDIAVMDVYAAQMAFGKEGRIDRIDVSFLPGESYDTMQERIAKVLPEGYSIDTPAGRTKQVEVLLGRFRNSMDLIGGMALFVGMYLIYNAVSIAVVQRRREIGILRALGAAKSQVAGLFLTETVVVSVIASLLGVCLGVVFAKAAVGLVAQSVTDMYVKASVAEISFSWSAGIGKAGIGVLASLVAAAIPSLASARISPVSAIRSLPYTDNGFLSGKGSKIASILCCLLAVVIIVAYETAPITSPIKSLGVISSAVIVLLIGISLATPMLLGRAVSLSHGFLASSFGTSGRLAGLNLQKNMARNSVAVAAILCSIALFVSSANTVHSLRRSMFDWIDSIIRADILVSSGHPLATGGSPVIPMPGEMLTEIEKIPGVQSVEPFRKGYLTYNGKKVLLEVFDVALRMEYCPTMITQGSREDMRQLLPDQDNIVVNEGFATKYQVAPGDSLVLPTPLGPKRFGVVAVVVSYTSDSGCIWMDVSTYRRHWHDPLVDTFEVLVQPKADIDTVSQAILKRFGQERKLFALSGAAFKVEVRKMLDRSFVLTNAVNIIALSIAGFGIIVTLLASILERTREIGILRAIGMEKRQVAGMVIIESILIGVVGGVLGSATGVLIGWIELEGVFRLDLGSSITYHIHYVAMAGALLLAAGLSALAGIYPARRAAKTNIVEALTYE